MGRRVDTDPEMYVGGSGYSPNRWVPVLPHPADSPGFLPRLGDRR